MTEPVQIVEIKQQFCTRTFGTLPCTASGTNDTKCYNTRATCQDNDNFDGGTLSLFFSKGAVSDRDISGAPYTIPSLLSVSTSPTRINLAGSSSDAQGLGNRALCRIVFADHQHTDRIVDPYLSGRSWDPLDADRGTFWQRWITRNKHRQGFEIVIYEGYKGQALSAMTKGTYFLERAEGPDAQGHVTIFCKDILAKVEERKAQAPVASPGLLAADISSVDTTINLTNCVAADYAAAGVVRIGDEIIGYASRAEASGVVTLSGCARGGYNTTATSHSADDSVQRCLIYTATRADLIVADLLSAYAGVAGSFLDTANWATEFDNYSGFYILDVIVTEPTAVATLLSELMVQVGFYLWWDEREAKVKWRAIRGVGSNPDILTDSDNIIADSFSIKEMPRQRVSQVWMYFDRRDYTAPLDDPSSYRQQLVSAGQNFYAEEAIRPIYARWLNSLALARNTANRILTRYIDTPSSCTFQMDAKDRAYWVGDTVRISHFKDRDEFGQKRLRRWTIVSAEEIVDEQRIRYTAEDTTLYGIVNFVMADDAPDYDPNTEPPFSNCYIGDANGLLSDGTPAGRIS